MPQPHQPKLICLTLLASLWGVLQDVVRDLWVLLVEVPPVAGVRRKSAHFATGATVQTVASRSVFSKTRGYLLLFTANFTSKFERIPPQKSMALAKSVFGVHRVPKCSNLKSVTLVYCLCLPLQNAPPSGGCSTLAP